MKKVILTLLVASSVLLASGYKIPETSINSLVLSGTNIAHTKSADTACDEFTSTNTNALLISSQLVLAIGFRV